MAGMLAKINNLINPQGSVANVRQDNEMGMDSYRVNERAWTAVIQRLHELRNEGHSMAAIGRLLKVNRATIKQWLDYSRGGDRISFRNMVQYLDKLRIPLEEIYGVSIDVPTDPPATMPTHYEEYVATILRDGAQLLGKRIDTITRKAFGEDSDSVAVSEMLEGKRAMTVGQFISICKAIGIAPANVLERATELFEEESGEDHTTRRTA
ncbi:hypothetical protein JCM16814_34590 [Desulfobaculum senezii]